MGPIPVRRLIVSSAIIGVSALASSVPASAAAKKVTVCKHGCHYTTIQSGVNATGKSGYVYVKPGKYVEGVTVSGHKHDGLHIIGLGKVAKDVVIEGKNAHGPEGLAQDGVEGDSVNNLDIENMKAENFASNGFFIQNCKGYTMRNLVGGFERSYGMYVFKCVGGRMTKSVGYGNGDSAFYIGGTPFQKHPVWSSVDHDIGYGNVLGYSGTNSKYIKITNNEFYDNGAGIVPNTLSSEPDQPADVGMIENNTVYWNNFDYYRKGSPVHTVSSGVGSKSASYPVGDGVILFATTDWTVKNNKIFGNWLWGASAFSDPTNTTGKAINNANTIENNTFGDGGHDLNGSDLFNDGSGKGTCFQNNGSVTMFPGQASNATLYPTCPTSNGTGTTSSDPGAFKELAGVVLASPPTKQESFWVKHAHATRANRTPYTGPPAKFPKGAGQ